MGLDLRSSPEGGRADVRAAEAGEGGDYWKGDPLGCQGHGSRTKATKGEKADEGHGNHRNTARNSLDQPAREGSTEARNGGW